MKTPLDTVRESVPALAGAAVDRPRLGNPPLFASRRCRRAPRILLVLAISLFASGTPVGAQPLYTAKDLGLAPSSTATVPTSLSPNGYVAGYSVDATGTPHAFVYTHQHIKVLTRGESVARGVNSAGQLVGYYLREGDPNRRAFLHLNGKLHDLGTLGGPSSEAMGINRFGEICGYAGTGVGEPFPQDHAFIYSRGKMSDLGAFGGVTSFGYAINDGGEVVGEYWPNWSSMHAFVYSAGGVTDLGTLGVATIATAINVWGEATGYSFLDDNMFFHAFIYSGGRIVDLGTLQPGETSSGTGINRWGQVVGTASVYRPSGPRSHAFLYAGVMHDLNDLVLDLPNGWVLETAVAINDVGQIAARALKADASSETESRAFLLTPVDATCRHRHPAIR